MKNLSFIFAALFMFSVSLVSCSEDDASIDVVSMDEGVTADGGKWLTANFYKPGLQLTCYHWLFRKTLMNITLKPINRNILSCVFLRIPERLKPLPVRLKHCRKV